jgi:hypothetical protein
MFGAPLRYVFSHLLGVDDSGDRLKITPAALSFVVSSEADMETKLGNVFVRRENTEHSEAFVIRASAPALFRYRDTEIELKPDVETVLRFEKL